MTRIVVAYDISAEADRAVDVVARSTWSAGTVVRLVTSWSGIGNERSSFTGRESKLHAKDVRTALTSAHERAIAQLVAAGLVAEVDTVGGKPARAVIEDARTWGADLIVVGGRRRSSIASALLGSVSAEIAGSAPCPVLVVRVASLERVILATDGAPAADAAVDIVASWPMFASAEVHVVGVAPPPSRYVAAVLSGDEIDQRHAEEAADARAASAAVVNAAVDRLVSHARRVVGDVRTGDAADEIAAAADDWPADLVVLGSSGGSFVRRVILGSVARSVAHAVHASVLIVRPPERPRSPDDAVAGPR